MKKKTPLERAVFFVPILATAGMEFFRKEKPEGRAKRCSILRLDKG